MNNQEPEHEAYLVNGNRVLNNEHDQWALDLINEFSPKKSGLHVFQNHYVDVVFDLVAGVRHNHVRAADFAVKTGKKFVMCHEQGFDYDVAL